jgi:hypothetical protein
MPADDDRPMPLTIPLADGGRRRFDAIAAALPDLLEELSTAAPWDTAQHPIPPVPGVYLLSEKVVPLYVGQTRNLRQRLRQHGGGRSRENQASFAFRLAREEAERMAIDLTGLSRRQIESHPDFAQCFATARARVAAMDVRFVEISDPELRTVFEVYAVVALGTTQYNTFETH